VPLRILAAPAGSGKTTAVATYLGTRPERSAYVKAVSGETVAELRERVARAVGAVDCASYDALLGALAAAAPLEVCIDDIDRTSPEALREMNDLVIDAPLQVALIYVMRARTAFNTHELLSRGLAVMLDAAALAFDSGETRLLAERLGVACSDEDAAKLIEATEGWPIVAGYVLRDCAESGRSATGAYERWVAQAARHFSRFITTEVERSSEFDATAFGHLLATSGEDDSSALESLEERGLFVRFTEGTYRPYRVLLQLWPKLVRSQPEQPNAPALPMMSVRMFGRFEASIDDRPVNWIRRRDAQLVKYLLLKPNGSASRQELRKLFWPEADFGLSTQSLRTACSNIRKALANVVGYDRVEDYFEAHGDVTVNLARTVLDVRRFSAHVGDGDAELDRGNVDAALAHYVAAERLYSGELLSGEPPEPWYEARAEMFKALHLGILQRLADLCSEKGDASLAAAYRERLRRFQAPGEPPRAATMHPAAGPAPNRAGPLGLRAVASS